MAICQNCKYKGGIAMQSGKDIAYYCDNIMVHDFKYLWESCHRFEPTEDYSIDKSKLKLYFVKFNSEEGWGVMVVAHNSQEAKCVAWKEFVDAEMPCYSDNGYLDVRSKWVKDITVPEDIDHPVVYWGCCTSYWMCDAWDCGDGEMCSGCAKEKEKKNKQEKGIE